MALIGKIEEYNKNDSWIEYTERLEQYFAANEITDNNKKRAVLLSVCGAKTYKLIRNLYFKEVQKKSQIWQLFNKKL